jgi:MFS family permease
MVLLFITCNLNCYMDRISISVAAPVIIRDMGWDEASLGLILSAFFVGYTMLQIPGGWLADRFGGKIVLTIGVIWWSFFMIVTPLAGTVVAMAAFRVCMGLGEGVNFPSIQSVIARWIPVREYSRVMGFTLSGISVGNIIAFPAATWIMLTLGWQYVFYVFGLVGIVWVVCWIGLGANTPEGHPHISRAELDYIRANRPVVAPMEHTPWKRLLTCPPVAALVFNHFCVSWGFFMFLTWLPSYLVMAHGFSLQEMGIYAMVPYMAMVAGSNATGWCADLLIHKTGDPTRVRTLLHMISLAGGSIFLVCLAGAETKPAVIALVTLALGMLSMTGSTTGPNAMEIAPRYAGIIMGMQTTAGNLAGVIVPAAVGIVVAATGNWALVFYASAAVLLAGAAVWFFCATSRQVIH